jgi:protein phosphatase methylesterase 1
VAALIGFSLAASAGADTRAFKIVDDPKLDTAISAAREEFLQGKPFDRLDATILVPAADGAWRRSSFNGDALAYPASSVKLAYLAAAMHWAKENGFPYDCLDHAVRPMIVKSDNVQTGVVVDAITSAPNFDDLGTTSDARWADWLEKRRYTARWLESRGLLGNQLILHKTYPSNSGDSPLGAEKVAREAFGKNLMEPRLSASLMLEIAKGAIEPEAHGYMMELLDHDKWKANSVLGFGMPPGTKYYNKPGLAYDTLEDIAYAVLPNGKEFVIAAYSNSFCLPYSRDPSPYNSSQLGRFMEILVEKTGLGNGCPPKVIVSADAPAAQFSLQGDWTEETSGSFRFGNRFFHKPAGTGSATATWSLSIPAAGKYEVCAWYTAAPDRAADATYSVAHDDGVSTVSVNQQKVSGRWFRLGDYKFAKGTGSVTLSDASSATTSTLAADTIKATRWPE